MTTLKKQLIVPARIAPIGSINDLVTQAHVSFAATANDKKAEEVSLDLHANPKSFFVGRDDGEYIIRTNIPELSVIFAKKSDGVVFIGADYGEIVKPIAADSLPVDKNEDAFITQRVCVKIDNAVFSMYQGPLVV